MHTIDPADRGSPIFNTETSKKIPRRSPVFHTFPRPAAQSRTACAPKTLAGYVQRYLSTLTVWEHGMGDFQ